MNYGKVGKINFNNLSIYSVQETIVDIIQNKKGCLQVVVANAYSIVLAHKDKNFSDICNSADIVFADGLPVV